MDGWIDSRWYAVHTKPTCEDSAAMNIRRMGVEVFLPKTQQERMVYGRSRDIVRPLFPGYLFARFAPSKYLHLINYARGVRAVVSGAGSPLPVEESIIDAIQSRVSRTGFIQMEMVTGFKSGDPVVVASGPLRGLKGIFDRSLSDRRRVLILLEAIEYQARVAVEVEDLFAAADAV